MEADTLSTIKEIAVILLLVAATVLCTIVAVAVAKLSPITLRSAENLEKVTSDLAAAGPVILDVLAHTKTTTEHLATATGNVAEGTAVLRLLGPAGRVADMADTGLGRLWDFIRPLLRR